MRADIVRKYLEKPGDVSKISPANLAKLPLGEQMVVSLIRAVIEDGNQSAFKTLMDAAYGVMAPGKGPDRDTSQDAIREIDWNLPKLNDEGHIEE